MPKNVADGRQQEIKSPSPAAVVSSEQDTEAKQSWIMTDWKMFPALISFGFGCHVPMLESQFTVNKRKAAVCLQRNSG